VWAGVTPFRQRRFRPRTDRTRIVAAATIAELTPASNAPAEREPDIAGSEPVIVVVEDNVDLNAMVCQALSHRYRVEAAFDGRSGLELARSQRPDLIVCDIMMPQLGGDQLLTEVRADPVLANTPVLMLTARATIDRGWHCCGPARTTTCRNHSSLVNCKRAWTTW